MASPGEERRCSRRDFLRITAAGTALLAAGAGIASGEEAQEAEKKARRVAKRKAKKAEREARGRKRIPIGLQLYSVRTECERDLPMVVEAVAKMGYEGVEFAGYYGRTAEELRKLLDSNGLKCCGTHTGIDTLLGDSLEKTIEFNKTLGNRYLIVPGLPEKYRSSAEAWAETAKLFNELAEKVKPHGMLVGYHNHAVEFAAMDGKIPWDIFFGSTKPEVVMQLDTGNALHGGGDPLDIIKRYPGRAVTVHIKEFSKSDPKALVGEGDIKWPVIFRALESAGATEWYIVEYESDAYPPLKSVELCLANLKKMGK